MQHRTPIILSSLRMHPPREQLWHMSRPVYHRRGLTGIDIFKCSPERCSAYPLSGIIVDGTEPLALVEAKIAQKTICGLRSREGGLEHGSDRRRRPCGGDGTYVGVYGGGGESLQARGGRPKSRRRPGVLVDRRQGFCQEHKHWQGYARRSTGGIRHCDTAGPYGSA